jgi:sRNA-binding carbon storage regulator CsrA
MLVLKRRKGERVRVVVGNLELWITVGEMSEGAVKLAFDGPKAFQVDREETAHWKDHRDLGAMLDSGEP